MDEHSFSRLNAIGFLQTFIAQAVRLDDESSQADRPGTVHPIVQLGLRAGACFELAYRNQFRITGPLNCDSYADLIVGLKNRIGGNFSRSSSGPGVIRVVNTRCPFGDAVTHAPELCRMTSSVFGGIAARNFGYAKVRLDKRIAAGDSRCDVCIYTDQELAGPQTGDEYFVRDDKIVGNGAESDVTVRVEQQMYRVWCAGRGDKKRPRTARPIVVARSPALRSILETVEVVAPTRAAVLIQGETGVGKEIVARAVHALSERWEREFVAVNCGAIPETLIETALFGHEKGAFTGAYEVHHGLFERAERGTLFLDEIDSLPLAAQVRLMRVVQEGEFERVGGKRTLACDVRIIAAGSNRLREMVDSGEFRQDLFYRLNVIPIHLPPLRERREDIPALVEHLVQRLSTKYQRPAVEVSAEVMGQMMAYEWPGNVREMENVLERSFLLSTGAVIDRLHFDGTSPADAAGDRHDNTTLREAKRRAADEIERRLLREALARHRGNVRNAAQELGLTPRAVHQKIQTHEIDLAEYRVVRS